MVVGVCRGVEALRILGVRVEEVDFVLVGGRYGGVGVVFVV